MALALAARTDLQLHVVHDERSAAFIALGIGLSTGVPAALLCTSGTAATHFHAAVVEADLSGVPMVVLTADRPAELKGVGAPQTIDQTELYGDVVRFYADPGVPDEAEAGEWRGVAADGFLAAVGVDPGPVHINLPFREPLLGTAGELPASEPTITADEGGGSSAGWSPPTSPPSSTSHGVSSSPVAGWTGRSLCSNSRKPSVGRCWPTPARVAGTYPRPSVRSTPCCVTLGSPPIMFRRRCSTSASRRPRRCSASGSSRRVPSRSRSTPKTHPRPYRHDHREAVRRGGRRVRRAHPPGEHFGDRCCGRRLDGAMADADGKVRPSRRTLAAEPGSPNRVWRAHFRAVDARLVVSSSMPVRDVEWYGAAHSRCCPNRGANGIDGVIAADRRGRGRTPDRAPDR